MLRLRRHVHTHISVCSEETVKYAGLEVDLQTQLMRCHRQHEQDATIAIYNRLFQRLQDLILFIYPLRDTDAQYPKLLDLLKDVPDFPQHAASVTIDTVYTALLNKWTNLEKDIQFLAEHIWRDTFLQDYAVSEREATQQTCARLKSDPDIAENWLPRMTRCARKLLLLWVQTRLYRQRMYNNYQVARIQPLSSEKQSKEKLRTIFKEYHERRRKWANELKRLSWPLRNLFRIQIDEVYIFKDLSKEFAPDRVKEEEQGWLGFAASVSDELRYNYFEALFAEEWHRLSPRNFLRWLGLLILRFTIGYGVRPGHFVVTTLFIVGLFAGVYATDDALAAHPPSWSFNFSSLSATGQTLGAMTHHVLHYVWLATIGLASSGSALRTAGPLGRYIQGIEPLVGYFLLAVLAALLVERLTRSER